MIEVFRENVAKEDNSQLIWMMGEVDKMLVKYEKGEHVMTDDKAPVELLGMKVIDELIQDEVAYYKEIFKTQGIKGVIDNL